jgi:hypothetical protein
VLSLSAGRQPLSPDDLKPRGGAFHSLPLHDHILDMRLRRAHPAPRHHRFHGAGLSLKGRFYPPSTRLPPQASAASLALGVLPEVHSLDSSEIRREPVSHPPFSSPGDPPRRTSREGRASERCPPAQKRQSREFQPKITYGKGDQRSLRQGSKAREDPGTVATACYTPARVEARPSGTLGSSPGRMNITTTTRRCSRRNEDDHADNASQISPASDRGPNR